MRFSNNKSLKAIPTACVFLLMFLLVCLFFKMMLWMSALWFYILTGLSLMILVYFYAKTNYFQYDSFGEKLRFENKKAIQGFLVKRKRRRLEFDKRKLRRYKLKNYGIYRSLEISFETKKNKFTKKAFDITYLSNRKIKLLQQSLDKVLNSKQQVFN